MPYRFYNFEFGWKFLLLFVNLKILEWELVWSPERLNWKQKAETGVGNGSWNNGIAWASFIFYCWWYMFIFCWWRGIEGENLGVEATRVFLKLASFFVKITRWVLVRMSLNFKLSSLNGRLPTCSKLKKAKERLHRPNSSKKWRRKLLFFFCLLVSVVLK